MPIKQACQMLMVFFVFAMHGINPFGKCEKSLPKARERMSEKEKKYIIDATKHESMKDHLRSELGVSGR